MIVLYQQEDDEPQLTFSIPTYVFAQTAGRLGPAENGKWWYRLPTDHGRLGFCSGPVGQTLRECTRREVQPEDLRRMTIGGNDLRLS